MIHHNGKAHSDWGMGATHHHSNNGGGCRRGAGGGRGAILVELAGLLAADGAVGDRLVLPSSVRGAAVSYAAAGAVATAEAVPAAARAVVVRGVAGADRAEPLLVLCVDERAGLDRVLVVVLAAAPVAVRLGVLEDVLEAAVGFEVRHADALPVDSDEGVEAVEVAALVSAVLGEEAAPAAGVLRVLEEELEPLVPHKVLDGDGELFVVDVDRLGVVVDAAVDVWAPEDVVDNLVVAPHTLGAVARVEQV